MSYVDGFLVPVRKNKVATYRRMAAKAGKTWREYGALEFRECIADDVKWGKRTSFPRSVKQKTGETVFLSYIVYKSRADRDRVNAKVMKDKRLAKMMDLKALPSRQSTSARLRPRRSMWACQRSRVGVARRLLGIRHKRAE